MLELFTFMLLLDPISTPDPMGGRGPDTLGIPKRCDDGSSLFRPDGTPNWRCRLDGCPPLAPVCWPERLDFCFDEHGDDTGMCDYEVRICKTKFSCFLEWAGCEGEWTYDWTTGVGSCTTAQQKPSTTAPAPGSAHAPAGEAAGADPYAPDSCPGPVGLITSEVHHAGGF